MESGENMAAQKNYRIIIMLILLGFIMYNLAGILLDIAIYDRETSFLLWRIIAIIAATFIFIISWYPRLLFKSQEYEKQIDYDKIRDIHKRRTRGRR